VRRALGFLGALALCGFVVLALFSYSALDPAISRWTSSGRIENWCGRWGALLSDMLYQLLGWAAWAVLPFSAWTWQRFARRPGGSMARLLTGALSTWWSAVFFGLLFFGDASRDFPAGGVIGEGTAAWLLNHAGVVGAFVVVGVVLLATCTVVFGIEWERVAVRGVDVAERVRPVVRRILVELARAVGGVVRAILRWVYEGLHLGARKSRAQLEQLRWPLARGEDPSRRGSELHAVEPGLGIPIERLEPEIHMEIEPTAAGPATDPHREENSLDGHVPTVVGARQMVEVEYVPTSADDSPDTWIEEHSDVVEVAAPPGTEAVDEIVMSLSELPPGVADAESRKISDPSSSAAPEDAPDPPREDSGARIEPGNLESGGDSSRGQVVQAPIERTLYDLPDLALLDRNKRQVGSTDTAELQTLAGVLTQKLLDFGIKGEVTAIRPGPVITIFEFEPAAGVKISKIQGLANDIAMAMKALRVRIVAPIPGRGVVGIEIPNKDRQTVWFRDMLVSDEFQGQEWQLPMALGKTVEGRPCIGDLARMPHLLVGGTTGSGKSVGINAMLMTLLFSKTPEDLRMILIDPKMLEFEPYQGIPHLLHPVVTEPRLAAAALKWACGEMDERYKLLATWKTRSIALYNAKMERELADWTPEKAEKYAPRDWPETEPYPLPRRLPYIVIVIDELADLMMVASKDVEESIVRLAQKARACGIHLIVATQRPSTDVITGLIKANMPSRIAFQVRSMIDGRTILDQKGAESLLGMGDMLYLPAGVSDLQRLHGPFVSDDEVVRVAEFLEAQGAPSHDPQIDLEQPASQEEDVDPSEYDEVYDKAVYLVAEHGKASTSMIQRYLKIGYNRAARIMDLMEREGVVGPAEGAKAREVLVGPPSTI
jgi:S-DNA-T family DNA segregation ATPase FtsK/SpoIIIE